MIDSLKIFIVGSSRSGTTMMGRILGKNKNIFTFQELHFFGTIWTNATNQELNQDDQIDLLARLFCIQEHGFFNQNKYIFFRDKAKKSLKKDLKYPLEIYKFFLESVTKENGAQIACEQTPKNLYYLNEILNFFPNARIINLVRDQRDVLLSQKNKWKRKFLGASTLPFWESFRSFINYHPILTSKVWNASLSHTMNYVEHPHVKIIKFEDLLNNPEVEIKDICDFLSIDFQKEMLEVPVIGSSTESDSKLDLFIDSSKINKWKTGGLSNSEIYLSQKFSSKMMNNFGYVKKDFGVPPFSIISHILSFPFKLILAFLLNIPRMGSIVEVIKKRFWFK